MLFNVLRKTLWIIVLACYGFSHAQTRMTRIDSRVEIIYNELKVEGATSKMDIPDNESYSESLLLRSNTSFDYYSEKDKTTTYYDFQSKMMMKCHGADTLYDLIPLHHSIDNRTAEFQNRIAIGKLMEESGIKTNINDPFMLECMFGFEIPENEIAKKLKQSHQKDTVVFSYNGSVVARIHFSMVKLPQENAGAFYKYLVYETELHPFIEKAIIASGVFPNFMEFRYAYLNLETIKRIYPLKTIRTVEKSIDYSVLKANWIAPEVKNFENRLDSIQRVVHQQKKTFIYDSTECFSLSRYYTERKKYLSGLLLLTSYFLQTGISPTAHISAVYNAAGDDPSVRAFNRLLEQPKSEEEARLAIKSLNDLYEQRHDYNYILLIFVANYSTPIDDYVALANFELVVKNNPFITGVYLDLGNIYRKQYEFSQAWKCYDIALQLNASHPMLKEIEEHKASLEKQYPDFFVEIR